MSNATKLENFNAVVDVVSQTVVEKPDLVHFTCEFNNDGAGIHAAELSCWPNTTATTARRSRHA
jgi:hypothetical protein